MSFWNIFGKMAVSDEGTTVQKLSDTFSVSSDGVTSQLALTGLHLPRWVPLAAMEVPALLTLRRVLDLFLIKKMILERIEM